MPPVPTPLTNTSILPSVSSQISGPVVFSWIAGLAGLSNCLISTILARIRRRQLLGLGDRALHALGPGVSTSLAPNAISTLRRSMLMVSGMVSTQP